LWSKAGHVFETIPEHNFTHLGREGYLVQTGELSTRKQRAEPRIQKKKAAVFEAIPVSMQIRPSPSFSICRTKHHLLSWIKEKWVQRLGIRVVHGGQAFSKTPKTRASKREEAVSVIDSGHGQE
jgi:hypothetical protein